MQSEPIVLTGPQAESVLRDVADDILREFAPRLRVDERDRPGKNWLTNAEAATYLGVSKHTTKRYRASGLPYSRKGQNVYYLVDDLEAWIEDGRVVRATT